MVILKNSRAAHSDSKIRRGDYREVFLQTSHFALMFVYASKKNVNSHIIKDNQFSIIHTPVERGVDHRNLGRCQR